MTLIKDFDGFLFEGRYDKLTGEICSAIMKKIKETNTGEEYFDGIKVIYKDTDDVPSFLELIENEKYFLVGDFVGDKMVNFSDAVPLSSSISGVDVTVYLTIVRDEFPPYPGDFILDGETDDQNSVIYTYISIDPTKEPECYREVSLDLRNLIRHEVEHLTQRGYNVIDSKKIRRNDATRRRIQDNPEIRHKYYKLKDEVPANLQGLYSEAKSRKLPFKDVVNSYLDKKVDQGIISPIEKIRIYRLWKNSAEKIGGLPPL